jgi:hypothetical protein
MRCVQLSITTELPQAVPHLNTQYQCMCQCTTAEAQADRAPNAAVQLGESMSVAQHSTPHTGTRVGAQQTVLHVRELVE